MQTRLWWGLWWGLWWDLWWDLWWVLWWGLWWVIWWGLWWGLVESAFGESVESGGRFCVCEFGSNVASVAVKMFSHLIYFRQCCNKLHCLSTKQTNKQTLPSTSKEHTMPVHYTGCAISRLTKIHLNVKHMSSHSWPTLYYQTYICAGTKHVLYAFNFYFHVFKLESVTNIC
jgi:hypothetical protein